MSAIGTVRDRLTTARRRLATGVSVLTALLMLCLFTVLKHIVPLRRLARWAWSDPSRHQRSTRPEQAVQPILAARRLLGFADGDCLQSSLLVYRMLSRVGAEPILCVGFRGEAEAIVGHAWVAVDGRVVADTAPPAEGYIPAIAFGRGGVLVTPPPR